MTKIGHNGTEHLDSRGPGHMERQWRSNHKGKNGEKNEQQPDLKTKEGGVIKRRVTMEAYPEMEEWFNFIQEAELKKILPIAILEKNVNE